MAPLKFLKCSFTPLLFAGRASSRCLSVTASPSMKRPVLGVPEPPKRPPTAYVLFVKENYGKTGEDSASKIISEIAKQWRNSTDEEKQVYKDQYERLKIEHAVEMKKFLDGIGGKKAQKEYQEKLKAYRSEKLKYMKRFRMKRLGLVKPRALSARNVYASEFLKGSPYDKDDRAALFTKVNENWAAMAEDEQKKYAEKAEKLNTTRLVEYEVRVKEAQKKGIIPKEKAAKVTKKKATKKKATKKKTAKTKSASKKAKTKKTAATATKKKTTTKPKTTKSKSKSSASKTDSTKSQSQDRQFSSAALTEDDDDDDDDVMAFSDENRDETELDSGEWDPDRPEPEEEEDKN